MDTNIKSFFNNKKYEILIAVLIMLILVCFAFLYSIADANAANDAENATESQAGVMTAPQMLQMPQNIPGAIKDDIVTPQSEDTENAIPLILGETSAEINAASGEEVWFSFTPAKDGFYKLYSSGSTDTIGLLYNAGLTQLLFDNDSGEDCNFLLKYKLNANATYYYCCYHYSSEATVFTVTLEEYEAVTSGSCGENLTWSYDDTTAALTISGTGDMADYSNETYVPWSDLKNNLEKVIIENGVTSIGGASFSNIQTLTDVTIPDSVKTIGPYAFNNCYSLSGIIIPNGVEKIDEGAFNNCSGLTEISIPASVASIGKYAFQWCDNISAINVAADNANYSSIDGVLFSKDKTSIIVYPKRKTDEAYTIPANVTSIEPGAFYQCNNLTEILIPNGTTTIGAEAFYNCGQITGITIPDGVTSIGESSFADCYNLSDIALPDSVINVGRWAFGNTQWYNEQGEGIIKLNKVVLGYYGEINTETIVELPEDTVCIAEYAFENRYGLSNIIIPDNVVNIGDSAFASCGNLSSVTIGNSVTSIGDSAFASCGNLSSVTIGNSVTSIGVSAFIDCNNLSSIVIPDSVLSIGDSAFSSCDNLRRVTIGSSADEFGDYAFRYCNLGFALFSGNAPTEFGEGVFEGASSEFKIYYNEDKTGWTAPEWKGYPAAPLSETVISGTCGEALTWTYNVLSATLTISGTGDMDDYSNDAFAPWYEQNRNQIEKVIIEAGVTNIGTYAFYDCGNVTEISIPEGVTKIGERAFSYCYNLAAINLPDSVVSLGEYAFVNCNSLSEIAIPQNINEIGDRAFSDCGQLAAINVAANNTIYSSLDGVLLNKTQTELIQYPLGKTAENFNIPTGVTSIGADAFNNCGYLVGVTIPNGVTSIGIQAFVNCYNLADISLPDSAVDVGSMAFYNTHWYNEQPEGVIKLSKVVLGYNGEINTETIIELPEDTVCIADYAFENRYGLSNITIPDNVVNIGDSAFASCGNLSSVTIGNSVTSIGVSAFNNCNNLSSIVIPDSVLSIGDSAFESCGNLSGVTLGSCVDTIGNYAFFNCYNLRSITISDSVISIGDSAFESCGNLKRITIGSSADEIGDYVFRYCNLESAIFTGNAPTEFGEAVFDGGNSNLKIYYNADKAGWTTPEWNGYSAKPYPNNAAVLTLAQASEEINLSDGEEVWLSFTPTDDGIYRLSSAGEYDTCCDLYDSNLCLLSSDDDRGVDSNFAVKYELNAGTTYYYCCYGNSYNAAVFTVMLESYEIAKTGSCGENLTWTYDDSTATLTISGTGDMYNYSSDGLAPWYEDLRNEIETVVIASGATNIGTYAFYDCSGLIAVTIPEGITAIGERSFYNCAALASIALPDSTELLGEYVFSGCNSLSEITIPRNVATIAWSAFRLSNLMAAINVVADNQDYSSIDGVLFNKEQTEILRYPQGKTAETYAIPDGVNKIGEATFYECNNLTSVTLPDGMTSIGGWAFYSCYNISEITLPQGITSIGNYTFANCSNLCAIVFPDSIIDVESDAMNNSGWYDAQPEGVLYLGKIVLGYKGEISADTIVEMPEETLCVANNAFTCRNTLSSITIGNKVKNIGSYAFNGCDSITELVIPDSVIGIGNGAFASCTNLNSVSLGSGVTNIAEEAFSGCNSITELTIPDNVLDIGDYAFISCTSLSSMTLGSSVTNIGEQAFYDCASLRKISIPENVNSIGNYAFGCCNALAYAYFTGDALTEFGEAVFNGGNSNFKIYYNADKTGWTTPEWNGYSAKPYPNNAAVLTLAQASEEINLSDGEEVWFSFTPTKDGLYRLSSAGEYDTCCELYDSNLSLLISDDNSGVDSNFAVKYELNAGTTYYYCCYGCSYNAAVFTVMLEPYEIVKTGSCGENLTWTYDDSTATLTISGTGDMYNYSSEGLAPWYEDLRNEIETVVIASGVTNVGTYAFYDCSGLTAITIPEGVTAIGERAFNNCNGLTAIMLPDSTESLGECTFSGCNSLHEITIPQNVTIIDSKAFLWSDALEAISVAAANQVYSSIDGVLFNKEKTSIIVYPKGKTDEAYTIPANVTSIGPCAFYQCDNLTEIQIPNGTTTIGAEAFWNCWKLTSIIIPDGVTSVGKSAFASCYALSNISLPDSITDVGSDAFNGTAWFDEQPEGVIKLSKVVLGYNGEISEETIIELPEETVCIADSAFCCCYNLSSITIPDSVLSIGYSAFSSCWNLSNVTIGNSVTSIGNFAFGSCGNLSNVTLGDCVETIGNSAFDGCSNLSSVIIPDSVTSIGDSAFRFCNLSSIIMGDSVTSIGDFAFYFCNNLSSITLGDCVETIGNSAFDCCSNLSSVIIPDSVTSIGDSAFESCGNLRKATIGSSADEIGDYAFRYCNLAFALFNGNAPTELGESVFEGVSSDFKIYFDDDKTGWTTPEWKGYPTAPLSETVISGTCGEALTWTYNVLSSTLTISGTGDMDDYSNDAFAPWYEQYRNQIEKVIIEAGVTSIGTYAFYDCGNITEILISEGVTKIGERTFSYCYNLAAINLPDSVVSLGEYAFVNCNSLSEIAIPQNINEIGDRAFSDCGQLAAINVAANNTIYSSLDGVLLNKTQTELIQYPLGKTAENFNIPTGVTSIGADAFNNCGYLVGVTIPNGVTSIGVQAFDNCYNLADISLPDSVINVESWAFNNTQWYNEQPEGLIKLNKVILGYNGEISTETIIELPEETVCIADDAFVNRHCLSNITIPASVVSIGYSAFLNCNFSSVTIPDSVISIGDSAFELCGNLSRVTIGSRADEIGDFAFRYCNLSFAVFNGNTPTEFGKGVFEGAGSEFKIYYDDDKTGWTTPEWQGYPTAPLSASVISGSCGEALTWTYNVLSATLTISGTGDMYDYSSGAVAPWYEGYVNQIEKVTIESGVTSIGNYAFYGCEEITEITISEGVTKIGRHAFRSCSCLSTITLPDSTESLGEYAFSFCNSLSEIMIPQKITMIEPRTFLGSDSLEAINVAAENQVYCSIDGVLFNKKQTDLLQYPQGKTGATYAIPNGVIRLGKAAFFDCDNLTSVMIPDSVTIIKEWAFCNCRNISKISIPEGVTSIGEKAFENCSNLCNVVFSDSITIKGLTSIGEYAFSDCRNLTSVIIPEGVTEIGAFAFQYCEKLNSITLPDSVTSVGQSAFYGTEWYKAHPEGVLYLGKVVLGYKGEISTGTNLILPDDARCIATGAFIRRAGISQIKIPESVINIGDAAFQGCGSITQLTIPDSVNNIGTMAFGLCSGINKIILGSNVISIGEAAFLGCSSIQQISFSDSVTNVGNGAFLGCGKLGYAYFRGNAPTEFGDSVFDQCNDSFKIYYDNDKTGWTTPQWHGYPATSVSADGVAGGSCGDNLTWSLDVFNGDFTVSGSGAMDNFTAEQPAPWELSKTEIKTVTIANGVTNIGDAVFKGCPDLTTITIPDTAARIGSYAFSGCSKLTTADIPDSVAEIEEGAFYGCTALNDLKLSGNVREIAYRSFASCSSLTALTVPDSVEAINEYAFNNCQGLNDVQLSSNVREIAYRSFASCSSLSEIEVPATLTTLGDSAFKNDTALHKALFKGDAPQPWLDSVFAGTAADLQIHYYEGTAGWDTQAGLVPIKVAAISIASEPNVTTYLVQDTLDSDGLAVKVNYADEYSRTITSGLDLDYDFSSAGEKTVTVSYYGQETTFNVTVNQAAGKMLTGLTAEFKQGSNVFYVIDKLADKQQLITDNLVVKAGYADGSSQTLVPADYELAGDLSVVDENNLSTLTIKYAENGLSRKAAFTVKVNDLALIEWFPDVNFCSYVYTTVLGKTASDGSAGSYALRQEDIETIEACTEIDIANTAVSSLQGIERFKSLQMLNCQNNNIAKLDISGCSALQELNCSNNRLTELDLTNNIALTSLDCSSNAVITLDINVCTALQKLNCSHNAISGALDVSGFTGLKSLDCSNNQLTGLNVSGCSALEQLDCSNNAIEGALDVSGFTGLKSLDCSNNQLTGLTVSGCSAMENLACSNNKLTGLNVSGCSSLEKLNCSNNAIEGALDVSNFTELTDLDCSNNKLTGLTFSGCSALVKLNCSSNALSGTLDVSACAELEKFDCSSNKDITVLKFEEQAQSQALLQSQEEVTPAAAGDRKLKKLNCSGTGIEAIDVSSFPQLEVLNVSNTAIENLDLDTNAKLTELDVSGCSNLQEVSSKLTFKGAVDGDKVIVDLSAEAAKGTISYTESSGTVYDSTNNTVTFSSKEVAAAGFDYTLTITNSDDSETRLIVDGSVIYVSALSITTEANVKTYYVGDSLSTDGITLQATYSDVKTIEEISDGFTAEAAASNCSDNKFTAAGDAVQVDLFYKGCSTEYTVVVKDLPVTEIAEVTFQQVTGKDYDIVTVNFGLALTQPSGYIIVAAYDADNKMLASSLKQVYSGDTSTECIIRGAANYATLKAFMVGDANKCQPLTAAAAAPVVQ